MRIGEKVRIRRSTSVRNPVAVDWMMKYAALDGVVEYISPHGWVLVGLLRAGTVLYREGFWVEDLTEVV